MKIDEQNLTIQSLNCETKTLRELYEVLQKEIERRKAKINEEMGAQSIYQKDLESKNLRISELE